MAKIGFLKNIVGGLKLACVGIPFLFIGGTVAGDITMITIGHKQQDAAFDAVAQTEFVQTLKDKEQKVLDLPLEESGLSLSEHAKRTGYIESDQFIKDAMKNYPELKEYKDAFNKGSTLALSSLALAFPLVVGIFVAWTEFSEDGGWGYNIIDNAYDDFEEARKIREEKKSSKELQDYDEEIVK